MRLSYLRRGEMAAYFQTDQEIVAVVAGFENCTTSKEGFTHLSHLTVAAYYLCNSNPDETFENMRFGLLRFLDHHGVDPAKYNDRVTWAWIKEIHRIIGLRRRRLLQLAIQGLTQLTFFRRRKRARFVDDPF